MDSFRIADNPPDSHAFQVLGFIPRTAQEVLRPAAGDFSNRVHGGVKHDCVAGFQSMLLSSGSIVESPPT